MQPLDDSDMLMLRFSCNKHTAVVEDDDDGGGCACVRAVGIWELSELSAPFCCEPKTALKK